MDVLILDTWSNDAVCVWNKFEQLRRESRMLLKLNVHHYHTKGTKGIEKTVLSEYPNSPPS